MMSDRKHLNLFSGLGESIDQFTIEKQLEWAEAFVCKLYSEKQCNTVNEARYELFKRKLVKNKTVSLSKIPPCKSVLKLHLSRSAYVAYLWRRSQENQIEFPPIDKYEWFLDGNIVWTDKKYSQQQLQSTLKWKMNTCTMMKMVTYTLKRRVMMMKSRPNT